MFNDLGAQWSQIELSALPKVIDLLRSGQYVGGKKIEEFEKHFSEYTGTRYTVGTSNGTDALKLSLQALQLSGTVDVVMSANTFIADAFAVSYQKNAEYSISLIDHDDYYQLDCDLLESHLLASRHKFDHCVIMAVHLYGHPVNMKRVTELSKKYGCFVIEDASQAHGARCFGSHVGNFSDMCAYSLYPGKNLGAAGDAGAITCTDESYRDRLLSA